MKFLIFINVAVGIELKHVKVLLENKMVPILI